MSTHRASLVIEPAATSMNQHPEVQQNFIPLHHEGEQCHHGKGIRRQAGVTSALQMPVAKMKVEHPTLHLHRVSAHWKSRLARKREEQSSSEDTLPHPEGSNVSPHLPQDESSQHAESPRSLGFSLPYHTHAVSWRASCHTSPTCPKNPKVTVVNVEPPLPSALLRGITMFGELFMLYKPGITPYTVLELTRVYTA